jgi:hypothetical protein
MKKRNPSSGQNGQLVHWWVLIHSGPQIQALKKWRFVFYLNNFHSQKVKPCDRTTWFSAGLHCQAHKGRWTVLIWGAGGVGVFSVLRLKALGPI